MPTRDWLRNRFSYGYDSGKVLPRVPGLRRLFEEVRIGGSYRRIFFRAVAPFLAPDSKVLELGPGKGSWTRAILKFVPKGEVQTIDFQDVSQWIRPADFPGRLFCHRVKDNSFACVPDGHFDFLWSFGVLCHNNQEYLREILRNSLPKMKPGGVAVHQFGDWHKLDALNWHWRWGIPALFKGKKDDDIWWPRNDATTMARLATEAGWQVVSPDLGLVRRDSMIHLRRPLS
jgi:SAM-dependent methyltransferase